MDSLDDMKIEEYLEKTGFAFMQVRSKRVRMDEIVLKMCHFIFEMKKCLIIQFLMLLGRRGTQSTS